MSEPGGDMDAIELVTSGEMNRETDGYIVTYREAPGEGLGDTTTTLMIEGPRVTLVRSGDVHTQMVFEQGRRHISYYDTAEGSVTVGVLATRVKSSLTERGGKIDLVYDVEIDNAVAGENHVVIDIREAGAPLRVNATDGVIFDRFIN